MDSDEVIGSRIRELRLLRGFSQRELADKVPDFTARIVMKVEQGTRSVRLAEAGSIADALGVGVDDLLEPAALADYEELARATRIHVEYISEATVCLTKLFQSHRNLEMTLRTAPPLTDDHDMVVHDLEEAARELLGQTRQLNDAMAWANRRLDEQYRPSAAEAAEAEERARKAQADG